MILGLYLLARFLAWIIGIALLVFVIVLYLIWLVIRSVGRALMDPGTWRDTPPRLRQRPHPRNERMYYSNRR